MLTSVKRMGLFLFFILFLAACGGGGDGDYDVGTDGTSEQPDVADRDDDTLYIGLDADPPRLDPHLSSTAVDRQVLHAIFDKLVDIDEDMNIIPKLAKDWDISDDNKTYTFYLEEDVIFHDGTPFNAEAVKFNFERMLDPEVGSARAGEVDQVEEVNVIDEHTVEVVLKNPYAPLLGELTDRAGMMLSPTAVEEMGDNFMNHPVGTGPYQFVEREQESHIKVERFDEYWGEEAIIETVIYEPYTDENIRMTNLISGNIDLVTVVSPKDVEKVEQADNVTLSPKEGNGFLGLHINTLKAPFDNEKIREAVNIGINRQALTEVAYGGGALPAVSAFPPLNWAHNPNIEVPENETEAAKQLVEESGVSDPTFTLSVRPVETDEQLAQMVQSMLSEVGITVNIEIQEIGSLLDSLGSGDFDAVYLGWDGRVDPDGSVSRFFMSDGYNNYTKLDNEEIDSLLTEARTTLEQEKRKELYQEFSEKLYEINDYIFLVHPDENKAMKNNVKGFIHYPDGMVRPHTIYFEE